jgi:hypothetical protein
MHKVRNFHEGHSTVGERQGSCRVVGGPWQGRDRGTAWECHGMCESALKKTTRGAVRLAAHSAVTRFLSDIPGTLSCSED